MTIINKKQFNASNFGNKSFPQLLFTDDHPKLKKKKKTFNESFSSNHLQEQGIHLRLSEKKKKSNNNKNKGKSRLLIR